MHLSYSRHLSTVPSYTFNLCSISPRFSFFPYIYYYVFKQLLLIISFEQELKRGRLCIWFKELLQRDPPLSTRVVRQVQDKDHRQRLVSEEWEICKVCSSR